MTAPAEYILNLPWPLPPINANDRDRHWATRARKVREVRSTAYLLARGKKLPKGLCHIQVQLHYAPRDNRRRDPSNLMPTQKALLDGLSAGTAKYPGYGLVPDDNPEYVTELIPRIHPPEPGRKTGRLWLTITVIKETPDA